MQKEVSFTIDSDVYEKLTMALQLSGEDQDEVFENCVKLYIAKTFGAISEEYSPDNKNNVFLFMIFLLKFGSIIQYELGAYKKKIG